MPKIRTLDDMLVTPSGGGLSADDALPWLIDVDVFEQAVSHVNWDAIIINSSVLLNAYKRSSGAQNDEINFDVVLAAGTWTFELMHFVDTGEGIFSVRLDGVEVGTIDAYSSAATHNTLSQITGISVASSGKKLLTLKMATKNASSTGYYGTIQHIQLRRTV